MVDISCGSEASGSYAPRRFELALMDSRREWRQDVLALLDAGGYATKLSPGNIALAYETEDRGAPRALAAA